MVSACFQSKPRRDIYPPVVYFETELGENICTIAVGLEKGHNGASRKQQLF
jgi:hypothetical protein